MFNKETEYALRGLVYIKLQNLKERRPGTAEVANEIDAPIFYSKNITEARKVWFFEISERERRRVFL